MRGKSMIGLTAILLTGFGSFCAGHLLGSPRPQQEQPARCTIAVPKVWGQYIGAGSRPAIIETVVVFPAPLGPSRPTVSPLPTRKLTPSTATTFP